jgi:hypothetical protein
VRYTKKESNELIAAAFHLLRNRKVATPKQIADDLEAQTGKRVSSPSAFMVKVIERYPSVVKPRRGVYMIREG